MTLTKVIGNNIYFRRFCIIDVVLLVVQPLNMFFFWGGGVGLVIFNLHIRVGTRSCVL